ncbi:MAG: GNAT family N-acetyltransferase [Pseudomonadota bacterium]
MVIRPTTQRDIAAVDALLAASYPALLKRDYPPSILVTALPLISRAQPKLVTCGTYFGVFDAGEIVAAGGWTRAAPGGARSDARLGHVRHLVTDHRLTRQGYGSALMRHILADAQSAGIGFMACQSTLTAAPFYRAMGFDGEREISVPLRAGIEFPAISMGRRVS